MFLNPKSVGDEAFTIFKLLDIGDWLGVTGETFMTRTGEPTIKATAITVLSKSLWPLPDKWHGIADRELQYRKRYLDLIASERSREHLQEAQPDGRGDPQIPRGPGFPGGGDSNAARRGGRRGGPAF